MGTRSGKIGSSPSRTSSFRALPPSPSAPAGSIVDLRKLLAERFPQPRPRAQTRISTGLDALDAATDGGLPKGAITELTSPHVSAGTALLVYHLLRAAERGRYFMALIDGRDSFDPQPLGNTHLRNLLWVRCSKAGEAIKAADLLLRDGNFPLVVLDLVLNASEELRKIPSSTWYRLQRLIEPVPAAFLVLTRHSLSSSAQVKLVLENRWSLGHLQEEQGITELQFRVRRVQGGRQEIARAG